MDKTYVLIIKHIKNVNITKEVCFSNLFSNYVKIMSLFGVNLLHNIYITF